MLRLGPADAPTVLVAPPLFEEANRTRAVLTDVLRRLADRGISGALPDLPGQGESLLPTIDARLTDWRDAFAAAAEALPAPVHVVAIRGGALVDGAAAVASRWYLSPQSGAALVRELRRIRQAAAAPDYAGNLIAPEMIAQLETAEPWTSGALRVVRLHGDPRAADHLLAAAPPWRAAEPGTDPPLQAAVADDIAQWIAACAG